MKKIVLILVALVFCAPAIGSAADARAQGWPFHDLQRQIRQLQWQTYWLQQQIYQIQGQLSLYLDQTCKTARENNIYSCPSNCDCYKVVFVSSETYNGDLDGLTGADGKCQTLAENAGLGGAFKAWLSDATTNARDRLTHSTFPYYTPQKGALVANNWNDIVGSDMSLQSPIHFDEYGSDLLTGDAVPNPYVWTGTLPNGTVAGGSACANWTSTVDASPYGIGVGQLTKNDFYWTYDNGTLVAEVDCASLAHLYCIQQ